MRQHNCSLWHYIGIKMFWVLIHYMYYDHKIYTYNYCKFWFWNLLHFQELAVPKAEEPDAGYLITNVELPPLCSSKYRPGPPSDHAQITSNLVSDIVINSKCVNLKDLCIVPDKLVWVVYCDMVCIDNDGSLVDACIMTLMASLKTCKKNILLFFQI